MFTGFHLVISSLAVAMRFITRNNSPLSLNYLEVPVIDFLVACRIGISDALCCRSEGMNPDVKIIVDFICQEFKSDRRRGSPS